MSDTTQSTQGGGHRPNAEAAPPEKGAAASASGPLPAPIPARELLREIKQRLTTITAREASIARREQELDRQYQYLEAYARELEQDAKSTREKPAAGPSQAEIDQRDEDLRRKQARLERVRAELASREGDLAKRQEEVERDRSRLLERRGELENREAAMTAGQSELAARHGDLLSRETELELVQTELFQRQAAVQRLHDEAEQTERRVRESQADIASLREKLIAHETELSQSTLRAEVERDTLSSERDKLEAERIRLARERDELVQAKAKAEQASRRRGPKWVWAFIPTAAFLAYFSGGALWIRLEPTRFRATAAIQIEATRVAASAAAAEHLRELARPGTIESRLDVATAADAYRAAIADGRLSYSTLAAPPSLAIVATAESAEQAHQLATAAASAYAGYAAEMSPEQLNQPAVAEWTQRRAALEGELTEARRVLAEANDKAKAGAGLDEWEKANAAFEEIQKSFYAVSDRLGEERGALAAQRAVEAPRGTVSDEALLQAIKQDSILVEDQREFASIAEKYQLELALSMLPILDVAAELRERVRATTAAVVEQRDLQPPADIRAALERAAADLEQADADHAEFARSWNDLKAGLERLRPAEQAEELVRVQAETTDGSRNFVSAARSLLVKLAAHVESIAGKGDVGTRAQVILSMLRGNVSTLNDHTRELAKAATSLDLEVNVKLDALDRQLRGVRGRISEREQLIRRTLQEEADRAAKGARDEQIAAGEKRVRELERQREDLSEQLKQQLGALRAMQGRTQDARALLADAAVKGLTAQRLESRLREIDAARPAPLRDTLRAAPTLVEQVAGKGREARARMTGVWSALGAALAASLLLAAGRARAAAGAPAPK
ncbi:MAG: hypothetical protein HZB38_15280 [Planctomycetes bacterium]|nr:hypothetical protein [Planctomycetota bacterium]